MHLYIIKVYNTGILALELLHPLIVIEGLLVILLHLVHLEDAIALIYWLLVRYLEVSRAIGQLHVALELCESLEAQIKVVVQFDDFCLVRGEELLDFIYLIKVFDILCSFLLAIEVHSFVVFKGLRSSGDALLILGAVRMPMMMRAVGCAFFPITYCLLRTNLR